MMLSDLRHPATRLQEIPVYPGDELAAQVLRGGNSLRITARGASMLPFLRDGDVVSVIPIAPDRVAVGDVICYESPPGRVFLHRVIRRDGTGFVAKGDALRFVESVDATDVLGTVVAVQRNGRTIGWDNEAARRRNRAIVRVTRVLPLLLAVALPVRRLLRAAVRG